MEKSLGLKMYQTCLIVGKMSTLGISLSFDTRLFFFFFTKVIFNSIKLHKYSFLLSIILILKVYEFIFEIIIKMKNFIQSNLNNEFLLDNK